MTDLFQKYLNCLFPLQNLVLVKERYLELQQKGYFLKLLFVQQEVLLFVLFFQNYILGAG